MQPIRLLPACMPLKCVLRASAVQVRIKQNGSDLIVGDFDDEVEAAKAYDRKARELGDKALINQFQAVDACAYIRVRRPPATTPSIL